MANVDAAYFNLPPHCRQTRAEASAEVPQRLHEIRRCRSASVRSPTGGISACLSRREIFFAVEYKSDLTPGVAMEQPTPKQIRPSM
jgi:hypothetical protein